MLLAVDIGNTNIVFGCVNDEDDVLLFERISTNHNATSAEYASLIKNILEMNGFNTGDIDDAVMSSVVPSVTNTVKEAIRKLFGTEVMIAGPGVKTGLNILIDNPAQLGSDQAVDAVAAINQYPVPLIIIDMGTATTIGVVDKEKRYIGGMVKMSLSSGKLRALGFAAFLAVYREGAEVILFYQALFNNASGDIDMIWLGFLAACVVLAIIFFLMQRGAFKIPIAPFFMVTSIFMFVLAVTFTGGGLKELQEAGVVPTTVIESLPIPSIDVLGLYPTYETVLPQVALILAAAAVGSEKIIRSFDATRNGLLGAAATVTVTP